MSSTKSSDDAVLWTPFVNDKPLGQVNAKVAGNRFGTAGGGPHGAIVVSGNDPACSGTSKFPVTTVAVGLSAIGQVTEDNPYVTVETKREHSISMGNRMKSWYRNIRIASNGDIYMSPNMLTFFVWLWQLTRTDEKRLYSVERGWLRYPYSHQGICDGVQGVLKATWKDGSTSFNQLVAGTIAERKEIDANGGDRHCRDRIPFMGLKLSTILRQTPAELQRWILHMVQDHPPAVALAVAGFKMYELSGLVGARRKRNRDVLIRVGEFALIDPLSAKIEAHAFHEGTNGDARLGSQNFAPMFQRFYRQAPGGLSKERNDQVDELSRLPLSMNSSTATVMHRVQKFGAVDIGLLPPKMTAAFRRWVSMCWLKAGLHATSSSPIASVEPSLSVFRATTQLTVLRALEQGTLQLHLFPAVADTVADVTSLIEAAELPESLKWLRGQQSGWKPAGQPVFTGTAIAKVVATADNALRWADLRHCIVAGATVIAVVLRPSRAATRYATGVTACERDLLDWKLPRAGDVLKTTASIPQDVAPWHVAHTGIEIKAGEWSTRAARVSNDELGDHGSLDTACAARAVHVHAVLADPSVESAMGTTQAHKSDPTACTTERVAIQLALQDDEASERPQKRRRT